MSIRREGVSSLWNSPDRTEKAQSIIALMKGGDMRGAECLLDRINGRWDLRGFDFSTKPGEVPFWLFGDNGVRSGRLDRNVYSDIVLQDFNFSGSLFSNSDWTDCEFNNCIFERADLYLTWFRGCSFKNVVFKDCWIENCLLGGGTNASLGRFENVVFQGGTFSRVSFQYPILERCLFRCKINRVNFSGSQLSNCAFERSLDKVSFSNRPRPNQFEGFTSFFDLPCNEMINIDFSKARFREVSFFEGIDLSQCTFPSKDGVIFIKDKTRIVPEAVRRIENEWVGSDREKGIKEARFLTSERNHSLHQVVVIPYEVEMRNGKDFAQKFIALIGEVNRECMSTSV